MIVLDTNVISEPLRRLPDPNVVEWINAQAIDTLFLTSITVAELRAGVALLPAGQRKNILHLNLETRVIPLFAGRILSFDLACTHAYAELIAQSRAAGFTITTADGYIASIAIANKFSIASRDTAPFYAAGAEVINPWE